MVRGSQSGSGGDYCIEFLPPSPFDTTGEHYANSATAGLDRPTWDSGVLITCAWSGSTGRGMRTSGRG